jgi:Zn-dependent membrane protease YugP
VNAKGYTGAGAAKALLEMNGISDVKIERIPGNLTDHYDPRTRVLRLSDSVYDSKSLAAVGVAAHETGHAVQHSEGYLPLGVRSSLFPVVSFGSRAAVPIFIAGLLFSYFIGDTSGIGYLIMQVGILMFTFVVAFQLVTLPVEFNASRRALEMLERGDILTTDEIYGSKRVLDAAALTYLAAAAASAIQLLRLVLLSNGRRR